MTVNSHDPVVHLPRAWLHIFYNVIVDSGGLLLGPLGAIQSPG